MKKILSLLLLIATCSYAAPSYVGKFIGDGNSVTNLPNIPSRPSAALGSWHVVNKILTNVSGFNTTVSPSVGYINGRLAAYWGAYTNGTGTPNHGSIHAAFGATLDGMISYGEVISFSVIPAATQISSPRLYQEAGINYITTTWGTGTGFETRPTFCALFSSVNGTNWTLITTNLVPLTSATHQNVGIGPAQIVKKANTYFLFYASIGSVLRENVSVATSLNIGGPYILHTNNPVVIGDVGFSGDHIATDETIFPLSEGGWGMIYYQEHPSSSFVYRLSWSYSKDLFTWSAPKDLNYSTSISGVVPIGPWVFEDNGLAMSMVGPSGVYLLRPDVNDQYTGTFTGSGTGLTNLLLSEDIVQIRDDFIMGPGGVDTRELPWSTAGSLTAGVSSDQLVFGAIRSESGVVANTGGTWYSGTGGTGFTPGVVPLGSLSNWRAKFIIKAFSTNTVGHEFGFYTVAAGPANGTDTGVYARYDTAYGDTSWALITRNGGSATTNFTGVLPDPANYQKIELRCWTAGTVAMRIGTNAYVTNSVNMPTVSLSPFRSIIPRAASTRTNYIDYYEFTAWPTR